MTGRRWWLGVLAAAVLWSSEAAAQSSVTLMRVPGIDGETTVDRYRGWIDLASLTQSWGPAGRRGSPCEIAVAKGLDAAGPPLWLAAVSGQVFAEVLVDVLKASADQPRFFQVKLTNARIATIATTSGGALVEQLTLSAETSTLTYWPQLADGRTGPPVTATVACGRSNPSHGF